MKIKYWMAYRGGYLKLFVYHIPAWLLGVLIVVMLLLWGLSIRFFHL